MIAQFRQGGDVTWVQLSNCEHGRSKCPNYWVKLSFCNLNCVDLALPGRHTSKKADFVGFPGNSFRVAPM